MNRLTASKIPWLIGRIFGHSTKSIELEGEILRFPDSNRREIPVPALTFRCHVKRGLFFNILIIPLESDGFIKIFGVQANQAVEFADKVNSARRDIFRRRFEQRREEFLKTEEVCRRLSQPKRYPTASQLEDFRNSASDLAADFPEELCREMLDEKDVKLAEIVAGFAQNAGNLREQGINSFLESELEKSKQFFDEIESNPLTSEQRRAVATDEDATLVLAGAGSGKTSVIVAKTSHLIKRNIRKPDEILLLAFGSDAAKEMERRIQCRIGQTVKAQTFHALGYEIIEQVEGRKPSLPPHASDPVKLREHLRSILSTLAFRPKLKRQMTHWFSDFMVPYRSEWDFKNKCDYYEYVRSSELRTLNGDIVKSHEELSIANWLYANGIGYQYEPDYEHNFANNKRKQYQPDFQLTESGIYIEHFGVRKRKDASGEWQLYTAPFVDREEYLEGMEWKRHVHNAHNTILIETYSFEKVEGHLLESLESKLARENVFPKPVPEDEILNRLLSLGQVDRFSEILAVFLKHFKNTGSDFQKCLQRSENSQEKKRNAAFLEIFNAVYHEYQKQLKNRIDFEDMIVRATDHVRNNRYSSPYRHILVDEFQDISDSRTDLLKALKSQHKDGRIFAVGDDWQSIYRFAGSDLNVMQDFNGHFGSRLAEKTVMEEIDLGRTFRCVDRIADAASKFIQENDRQIRKKVRSNKRSDSSAISIIYHKSAESKGTLLKVLNEVNRSNPTETASVLLLGRYNYLKPDNLGNLDAQFPSLKLKFMSIHASKGLEADHVVILNANSGDFPSEITDDPVLDMVLPVPENFPHAEERRVFYVALTRAKKSVFILSDMENPSCFVEELSNDPEYGVRIDSNGKARRLRCPNCQGPMFPFKGKGGTVYFRCAYKGLCETYIRACESCNSDFPGPDGSNSGLLVCSCGASYPACPNCRTAWLVERKAKRGRFLGCVNFPNCKETMDLSRK